MVSRRTFLKSSLIFGGIITAGSIVYWKIPADILLADMEKLNLKFFNAQDQIVLTAIIPVILSGSDATRQSVLMVIKNMDNAIQFLPMKSQQELRDLFSLLANKLARAMLAGIWSSWKMASAAEISLFLISWQNSFFDLLQTGYQGLTQLVFGNYYAEPVSWKHLDYPGPPILTGITIT